MTAQEAKRNQGVLVLSFEGTAPGGRPSGPFTLRSVKGSIATLERQGALITCDVLHLVLNETWPMDFDDREDPECPTTPGAVLLHIMSKCGLPEEAVAAGDATIFVFPEDSHQRIENALAEMGWTLTRTRPWKEAK